jgi:hypothetical protein
VSFTDWLIVGLALVAVVYAVAVLAPVVVGRRSDARALAGFIPDFIPVAGQVDDGILVALVLRAVLRLGGEDLLRKHWSGPPRSFGLVRRLAFGPRASAL